MPYRRTDNVTRRLAEREQSILAAARAAAVQGGMGAVQIANVAERAGVAAGTIYRYFPSKSDLVEELIAAVAESELAAIRAAANAAPGPLSALTAAIAVFAARLLNERRLAWAAIAEPADGDGVKARQDFRKALTAEFETRMRVAMSHGHFPEQDLAIAAPALVGALLDSLIGPLAPEIGKDAGKRRDAVQGAALFALRALGVVDARARGLVAQIATP